MSFTEYTPDPFTQNERPVDHTKLNAQWNSLFQMLRMGSRHSDPSKGGGGAVAISLAASGTATIVDDSIDWRDRLVTLQVTFVEDGTNPDHYLPGGASDDSIGGKIEYPGSGNDAQIFTVGFAAFYTQAGGTGGAAPWVGIKFNNAGDQVIFWADSSTGELKMKLDNAGTKLAVNAIVMYSPDYGQY